MSTNTHINKPEGQLIDESTAMRQRIAESEASLREYKGAQAPLKQELQKLAGSNKNFGIYSGLYWRGRRGGGQQLSATKPDKASLLTSRETRSASAFG